MTQRKPTCIYKATDTSFVLVCVPGSLKVSIYITFSYDTTQKSNNKCAEQTAHMRSLIGALVLRTLQNQVFSRRGHVHFICNNQGFSRRSHVHFICNMQVFSRRSHVHLICNNQGFSCRSHFHFICNNQVFSRRSHVHFIC